MNVELEKLNNASAAKAGSVLRDCCGSTEWARRMIASRPFSSERDLIETASDVWKDLRSSDRLEAFAAHPKIGETKATGAQQKRSVDWSTGEQAGMKSANDLIRRELAGANQKYFDKFGFIFIVCATGKTAHEMLELCRKRLGNDREYEIEIAAEEQRKITEIRLRKLLSL